MIRVTLFTLVVAGLALYAWRDWFKSLCGLILLMAVIEHPDLPKSILGIQGLNAWNLLLVSILLGWVSQRHREGLVWDMPRHVTCLLALYLCVILVSFLRLMADTASLMDKDVTSGTLISEHLVNTIKWVIPGLLLFDGCRTRPRFTLAVVALVGVYALLALQVIRWMPMSAALSGQELSERSAKILLNEIGYHRVNLSMMLAGASWAIFATRPLAKRRSLQVLIVAATLTVAYAQGLTGGRMGYVTWGVVGFTLCAVRWRKYLLAAPLVAVAFMVIVPGMAERMLQGITGQARGADTSYQRDTYEITSGRDIAWPYVIDKIQEAPVFGYGRLAMERTGIRAFLKEEFGELFPHPHNAYLEMLLDNGWWGLVLVLPFYLVVLGYGFVLFRDSRSPVGVTIGGVACALVLALLVASLGSQTFYPREGAVGMWCAIGLLLRVAVERSRVLSTAVDRTGDQWWTNAAYSAGTAAGDRQWFSGDRRPANPSTAPAARGGEAMLWSPS
jgi:O-antigen ligase